MEGGGRVYIVLVLQARFAHAHAYGGGSRAMLSGCGGIGWVERERGWTIFGPGGLDVGVAFSRRAVF